MIVALTGALGITPDPGESPAPAGPAMVAHGLLPIADQLTLLAQALPPSCTPRCAS